MIFIFILLTLLGCSSTPPTNYDENSLDPSRLEAASIPENSPEFQSAARFDRYVHGSLTNEEVKTLKLSCKKSKTFDRFCVSYLSNSLYEKIKIGQLPPKVYEPKTVQPSAITMKHGRIKNWNTLRKEKVPPLLKAMNAYHLDEIRKIAAIALKEKRCPNAMAVAAGATLEDYLPDKIDVKTISSLYERAARCFPRGSQDRENFITRAGLLNYLKGNRKEACRLLSKATPSDAFSGRPLYWAYRCASEKGEIETAKKLYQKLTSQYRFSFHALVAATMQGMDLSQSFLSDKKVFERSAKANEAINQQIELLELLKKCGFTATRSLLASWTLETYRNISPEIKVHIASLADAPVQVLWVSQLLIQKPSFIGKETLQLAYPRPYFNYFEKQSQLDPYLLLALARKESHFNPIAVSPTNAQGLLQIQPETAKKLIPDASFNLLDPRDNISLGAKYLTELLSRLNNNMPLVLAAYNAGEEAVKNWLFRYGGAEPLLFIDLIPYRETRDYVGSILSNYYWYSKSYGIASENPVKKLLAVKD